MKLEKFCRGDPVSTTSLVGENGCTMHFLRSTTLGAVGWGAGSCPRRTPNGWKLSIGEVSKREILYMERLVWVEISNL
jgi:hypothetical protein